jgi:hypothetical protein
LLKGWDRLDAVTTISAKLVEVEFDAVVELVVASAACAGRVGVSATGAAASAWNSSRRMKELRRSLAKPSIERLVSSDMTCFIVIPPTCANQVCDSASSLSRQSAATLNTMVYHR